MESELIMKIEGLKLVLRIGFAVAALIFAIILCILVGNYFIQNIENNKIKDKFQLRDTEMPTLVYDESKLAYQEKEVAANGETKKEITPIEESEAILMFLQQPLKKYDHEGLKEMNGDYVGWLDIPNTNISYPVVQSKDNIEYLTNTFDGHKRSSGSIFIDANIEDYKTSRNIVIHGHNMKSGSMFGTLPSYTNINYYNNHPFIYFYTPGETMVYQVISAYAINNIDEELTYQDTFRNKEEYQKFLELIIEKSMLKTRANVSYNREVITLSTCVNHSTSRFIVHGIRFQ